MLLDKRNIHVSGPISQGKAKKISEALKIEKLEASSGWLFHFCESNNIIQKEIPGEKIVDVSAALKWKEKACGRTRELSTTEQFHADETAFFLTASTNPHYDNEK